MQIENFQSGIVPLAYKTKTKCTKMTDESDLIKNGINGASTSVATNEKAGVLAGEKVLKSEAAGNVNSGARRKCASLPSERDDIQATAKVAWTQLNVSDTSSTSVTSDPQALQQGVGGRLQFFKDGKFILEIARTREGEKESWVSVPRKTFWPLSSSTIVYPKNESSASLSFSDDNSSIQSSPWQRDHCWKQSSPRKNISKEMCMIFKRNEKFSLSQYGYKIAKCKRRRPYDTTMCKMPFKFVNGLLPSDGEDCIDGKDKSPEEGFKIRKTNGESKKCKNRAKLTAIIQKLIDKLPTGLFFLSKTTAVGGTVLHFPSTPSRIAELHHPQQHVSPRKRILRELEKVSLEDSTSKRCRAKSSSTFSSSINTSVMVSQSTCQTQQNSISSSNSRSGQISNGSLTEPATTVSTPSRLYSSYSIHSLLGNVNNNKNEQKDGGNNSNQKEINDPSYLRIMLAAPKSQDSVVTTSSAITNHTRESPSFSPPRDSDYNNINRFKTLGSAIASSSTTFHPYLSSPKYSSSNSTSSASNDNYKPRAGRAAGSPSHQANSSTSRRSSPLSPFSQLSQTGANTRFSNQTSPNNNRLKENPSSGSISPRLDRRESTPRTVPKKTAALRQQFSTISATQGESPLTYTSISEQKKKHLEERTVSPDQPIYHSPVDMDHSMGAVLRSSSMPPSALYYIYPRHSSPSSHTTPSYIPPVSYYHPYAAAVAALRNPLWMHYQGVVQASGPPTRLGPSMFPYNGASPGPPPLPTSLSSMHLSAGSVNPWTPSSQQTLSTEDSVSLVSKKDEQSSDTPLNLSKH